MKRLLTLASDKIISSSIADTIRFPRTRQQGRRTWPLPLGKLLQEPW